MLGPYHVHIIYSETNKRTTTAKEEEETTVAAAAWPKETNYTNKLQTDICVY